jgi:ribonuclease P protein component
MTVVASRRVGNAVQRNRAKRLLREAARTQDWRDGIDVVLVARSACVSSGLAEVTDELRTLGARLGVLDQQLDAGDVHEGAREDGA